PSQGSRTVPQHPPAPALATRNTNRSPHPLHLLDHTSRTTRPAGTGPSSRGRGTGPHEHWTTVTDSDRDPRPTLRPHSDLCVQTVPAPLSASRATAGALSARRQRRRPWHE